LLSPIIINVFITFSPNRRDGSFKALWQFRLESWMGFGAEKKCNCGRFFLSFSSVFVVVKEMQIEMLSGLPLQNAFIL